MLIGLIPSFDDKSYYFNTAYINYVTNKLKAVPVVITSKEMIKHCNSILLTGGVDIDPTIFGFNNYSSKNVNRNMDLLHVAFVEEAVKQDKDILGICRGFQLLSYIFLLPMYKELEYCQDIDGHNQGELNVARNSFSHKVFDVKTSKLEFVNSMHHQCLVIPSGFDECEEITYVTAFAAPKKSLIVEGFSMKINNSNISAVQWHPEELI
jgi:putative glutamine amidotransferase